MIFFSLSDESDFDVHLCFCSGRCLLLVFDIKNDQCTRNRLCGQKQAAGDFECPVMPKLVTCGQNAACCFCRAVSMHMDMYVW